MSEVFLRYGHGRQQCFFPCLCILFSSY